MARVVEASGKLSWLLNPDYEGAAGRLAGLVKVIVSRLPGWAAGAVVDVRDVYGPVTDIVDEETGETATFTRPVDVDIAVMPVAPSKFNDKAFYFKHTWRRLQVPYDTLIHELKGYLVTKNGEVWQARWQESCTGSGAVTVTPVKLLAKIQL